MRDGTPPKKQRKSYSGKKKHHTIKDQLLIDGATGRIICIHEAKGSVHDLELFKQSNIHLSNYILLVGDKGYQGLSGMHPNSLTPYKKPHKGQLTKAQKDFNRRLSKFRIFIEHVNRRIKRFRIFSGRYRNKQRRHLLRFSLICGVHNFELGFRTGLLNIGPSAVTFDAAARHEFACSLTDTVRKARV